MHKKTASVLLATIIAALLASCSSPMIQGIFATPTPAPAPCIVQAEEFLSEMEVILGDWDMSFNIAASSPRIGLAQPIMQLQEVRRRASELEHPACTDDAYQAVQDYMKTKIDMLIAFMGKDDREYNRLSDQAEQYLSYMQSAFAAIRDK